LGLYRSDTRWKRHRNRINFELVWSSSSQPQLSFSILIVFQGTDYDSTIARRKERTLDIKNNDVGKKRIGNDDSGEKKELERLSKCMVGARETMFNYPPHRYQRRSKPTTTNWRGKSK
jgi:hypothetical protein